MQGSQKDYKIANYLGEVVLFSLVLSHLLTYGFLGLSVNTVDVSLLCGP